MTYGVNKKKLSDNENNTAEASADSNNTWQFMYRSTHVNITHASFIASLWRK